MNPFQNGMGGMPGMNQGTNLLNIITNLAFGFVIGLMVFFGPKDVIDYGTKLAGDLMGLTSYGKQFSGFGFATTALPYVILAPIGGLVVRELSRIKSLKTFGIFVLAVAIGFVIAFFTRSYFTGLI
ncbi:hypothetical protein KW782_01780 [Candidatus Parcubacteria bacterium]|nr:hypothetical protein [Candidatus Parcubacteria bacterium]